MGEAFTRFPRTGSAEPKPQVPQVPCAPFWMLAWNPGGATGFNKQYVFNTSKYHQIRIKYQQYDVEICWVKITELSQVKQEFNGARSEPTRLGRLRFDAAAWSCPFHGRPLKANDTHQFVFEVVGPPWRFSNSSKSEIGQTLPCLAKAYVWHTHFGHLFLWMRRS